MFSLFFLVILPVCRALKEMDHGKSGAQFEADFIKCLDEAQAHAENARERSWEYRIWLRAVGDHSFRRSGKIR